MLRSVEGSLNGLRRLKLASALSIMGQQRVSNIALINTEREYAFYVVYSDIKRIIDIFGRRNGRDSYFLMCFMSLYNRFICDNIFTSYVGLC